MEELRRKMAADPALFNRSVISVGSSDSSSAPIRVPKNPGKPRTVIAISDSESDSDKPKQPLKNRVTSGQKPTPVQIPSNKDVVRTRVVPAVTEIQDEDGTLINVDAQVGPNDHYDTFKSTSEVDKELKELFSGTTVDHTIEIEDEDTIVPGFGDDFRLLHHQVQARRWMKDREEGGKHGGILADDMGLGKTIQTLVRIVEGKPRKADREKGFAPSTLVVAPTSLATQWQEEIQRMTSLKVVLHTGANRTNDPTILSRHHIVITTYGTVASEHNSGSKKKALNALFNVKWWRIVLDEAHTIKNRTTKNAKACFDLQGNHRWCLTGTPIQNKVEEFYSLMHFLRIKPLNDWTQFKEKIVDPLKKGRSKAPMKRLHAVLKFVMLRRSKDDTVNGKQILDLPPKVIDIVHCDFSSAERRFYRTIEAKMAGELERLEQLEDNRSYMHMLTLLLRARQACNHPILVTGDWKLDEDAVINRPESNSQEEDEDAVANELINALGNLDLSSKSKCQICFKTLETNGDKYCDVCAKLSEKIIDTSVNDSAKIRKIIELVDEIEERSNKTEKIIIFSQFTTMLGLISKVLEEKGIKYVQYDGSMNQKKRASVINVLKEDPRVRVILMSFKAGGVGLNLTVCNNIILVDLWWNPALEDQAFGRAHRIGQKRQVNIWKLTIEDTVEDRILDLQQKKRELAEAALSGEAMSKMATLGRDELMALFKRIDHDEDEENDEDD